VNPLRQEVNAILLALLGSEELVQRWWVGDNVAFEFRPPQQLWDESYDGQQEVANYVFTHGYR
jgi:hypothetical protein